MDYSKGIPDEAKSMVVIPTLISSISSIDQLVEGLEVRFLANRDANLYFALLTDFKDAATEHLPEDGSLLLALKNRIIELNKKYQRTSNDTFFLFTGHAGGISMIKYGWDMKESVASWVN